jgi:hypothetical protein
MILQILTDMKKFIITSIITVLIAATTTTVAQNYQDEYLGLPGDNLNLYAVMDLFQKSQTLEGFERSLNDENSRINNLDLNGDKMVDYIMVKDYIDGNVHNIVMRVALNRKEYQDVAVFTVQRFRNGSVEIQLVGDEDLYGRNYIVEPIYADNYGETVNPGYSGGGGYGNNMTVVRTTGFEIASWPLIRFIYMPSYIVWNSSWHWNYYPSYWHPWRPYYWHYYAGYHSHWYPQYYGHYRLWHENRYHRYNDFYYSDLRSHSHYVSSGIRDGHYKSTYSHPEQRRAGEALYTEMNSDHNGRNQNSPVNRSGERRSVSNQTQKKILSDEGSTQNRRSINTSSGREIQGSANVQNAGSGRRTLSTYSKKSEYETERRQDNMREQKATNEGSGKANAKKASSSDHRITKVSKPENTLARSNNTRQTEERKTSRRK